MIGPWYCKQRNGRSNRLLLAQLLAAADPTLEMVIDLICPSPLALLLSAAGFFCLGLAALMVSGDDSGIELSAMLALASLGSVG